MIHMQTITAFITFKLKHPVRPLQKKCIIETQRRQTLWASVGYNVCGCFSYLKKCLFSSLLTGCLLKPVTCSSLLCIVSAACQTRQTSQQTPTQLCYSSHLFSLWNSGLLSEITRWCGAALFSVTKQRRHEEGASFFTFFLLHIDRQRLFTWCLDWGLTIIMSGCGE